MSKQQSCKWCYEPKEWHGAGAGKVHHEFVPITDETTSPESQAAAVLGRKGGRSKSEAKQNAARENGKKGVKPKLCDMTDDELDNALRQSNLACNHIERFSRKSYAFEMRLLERLEKEKARRENKTAL